MRPVLLPILLLASVTVGAQTIWRCGEQGRQFQSTPCADGRPVWVEPAPGAAAQREAQAVAQRERVALQTLAGQRRERLREAQLRGFAPAAIRPLVPTAKPSRKPRPPRPWVVAPPPAG